MHSAPALSCLGHSAGVALLPKMDWQMNKRNRPPIDEDNYDAYADQEVKLVSRRFQQQRLGSEPARQEEELATQQKGPHANAAAMRKSMSDLPGNLDSLVPSGSKTHRLRGLYDDRGLTLASCIGSPRAALSSTKGTLVHPALYPPAASSTLYSPPCICSALGPSIHEGAAHSRKEVWGGAITTSLKRPQD
jgi:hypothetical protein